MRLVLAIACLAMTSGCWVPNGSSFVARVDPEGSTSPNPHLLTEFTGYGVLPLSTALVELRKLEVVSHYPPGRLPEAEIAVSKGMRIIDVIRVVELETGWIYESGLKNFTAAAATHSVDSPDAFGRPGPDRVSLHARSIVTVCFRFRRIVGGVTKDGGNVGLVVTSFAASIPEGVEASWQNTQERTYFEQAQSTQTEGEVIFNTARRTVQAGLHLQAIAARIPGGRYRLDGQLEISSFVGTNLEKAQILVPLQIDGTRDQWDTVLTMTSMDAGAQLALRGALPGFNFNLGGERVELQVCVR